MQTQSTAGRSVDTNNRFADLHSRLLNNMSIAVTGKDDAIDLVLLALIAEGHILVEDVPGVGKTTLAKALARSIDTNYGRIQFTPDLLPSDVVGVNIWNRATGAFDFRAGPVFANIVLADEINRASPKTQSALLEAMAEHQVTIDGTTRHLPPPFLVIATQNPIESDGTYPLPESQLDRFILKISMGYPNRAGELAILQSHGVDEPVEHLQPVLNAEHVQELIHFAKSIHVDTAIQGYLVDIADATRHHPDVEVGMSPRATLALQRLIKARAASRGRGYAVPDDVKALAEPVIAHRLVMTGAARIAQVHPSQVVREVLAKVAVPTKSRG